MRSELKYVLPNDKLSAVRRAIEPFVDLDKHGKGYEEVGYTVRSIYLDSPRLRYYQEKQEHLQNRKKIRVRGYNDPGSEAVVFLEIKRKMNAKIAKERAPVRYDAVRPLLESGRYHDYILDASEQALTTGRHILYHVHKDHLRPTCLVVYEREAFLGKFDRTFRITLDQNLRSAVYPDLDGLFQDEGLRAVMPGSFIIEIKYNTRMPAWARQVIAEFCLIQRSASKYCLSLDRFERRFDSKAAVVAAAPPVASSTGIASTG